MNWRCATVKEMKQIHDFAVKWCDKFRDQNINYIDLVDHFMADDCDALGFGNFIFKGTVTTNNPTYSTLTIK